MKWLRSLFLMILIFSVATLASASPVFQIGDSNSEITTLQQRLQSLGYEVDGVDGTYGTKTEQAVRAFQRDRGLEVDGVIGSQTYRALMSRDMPVSRSGLTFSRSANKNVIETAMDYRGVPYLFGGTTPRAFDCSGFTRYIFGLHGIYLPRMADEQFGVGQPVSYNRLEPGDLVFFTTYTSGVSHTGIYVGNGRFISATSSRGVAVDSLSSSYWGSRYMGARRVM